MDSIAPERDGSRAHSVTIPGKIARFLDEQAKVAFAGTRDSNRVPFGHRVSGWNMGAGGRVLTAFVADGFTVGLVESLQDNGEFALTVEDFPSHETYQFKGRYLRHRPIEREDIAIVDGIRERFVKSIRTVYPAMPVGVASAFIAPPALAVEFDVCEIYLQTPGPGAGTRLVPAES
jgi:hypothetical protein